MDKVAKEPRIKTIHGLTMCSLPVFSAQSWTSKITYSITGWLFGTLPSEEGTAICPHLTWHLLRVGCKLLNSPHHMVSN